MLILKARLHKQLTQITKVHLNFDNTLKVVTNLITLFHFALENNEKMEKKTGIFHIPDRNCLCSHPINSSDHIQIKVIQRNNILLTQ